MLKSYGVGGGGGLEQFSVSPRPLDFGLGTKGFGAKGLGPGLDNKTKYFWLRQFDEKEKLICAPGFQGDCFVSGDHRCPRSGYHSSSS